MILAPTATNQLTMSHAAQVKAIGGILADASVPVKRLGALLIVCPELLACSPDDLHRRVSIQHA